MGERIEPAPDTSDERLVELIRWTSKSGMPDVHALLLDLQQLRAAQTASAEQVRAVVRSVVREAIDRSRHLPHGQAERAIADRVASQLASDPQRDGCQFCRGAKGGTPGNENRIGGVTICDYCTSLLRDIDKARVASQLGPVGLSDEERATLLRFRANEVGAKSTIGHLGHDIVDGADRAIALLDRLLGVTQ